MGLSIRQGKLFTNKLIFSVVAVFALVAQPMYGLVASQVASAVSATVNSQSELVAKIGDTTVDTITLGSSFTISSQVDINRTLTLDGGGHTLSGAAGWSGTGSNDSILGVTAGNPTISNLIVDGAATSNVQGIQIWQSSAVLNKITAKNNQKAGIHVNGSTVAATDITTSNNSRGKSSWGIASFGGILVSSGTLTIGGQSHHTSEGNQIRKDGGTIVDSNNQYSTTNVWGIFTRYTLKPAPAAPAISDPTEGQTVTTTNGAVAITWNAVSGAHTYLVSIDGGVAEAVSGTSLTKTLTEGPHTVTVQSVAQSGLLGGISAVRNFTVADYTPPMVPYDLIYKMSNGSARNSGSWANLYKGDIAWKHDNPSDVKNYVYYYWNDISTSIFKPGSEWRNPNIYYPSINGGEFTEGEGKHFFCVAAVDAIGNESACSETFEIGYDKTDPTATITAPTGPVDTANPFTIKGSFSDNLSGIGRLHLYISANGREMTNPFQVSNGQLNKTSGDFEHTLTSADLTNIKNELSLKDGDEITIRANVFDKANNWSNTTSTITSDTAAPTAEIKSPDTGDFVKTANEMEIKLHAADAAGMKRFDVTIWDKGDPRNDASTIRASWGALVPSDGTKDWTASFKLANNLNLPDGEYTIYFTATDLLGRYGNAESVNFTIDSKDPVVILYPIAEAIEGEETTISGKVEDTNLGDKVVIGIDGTYYDLVDLNADGTFTLTLTGDDKLSAGSHTVTAISTDKAGNEGEATATAVVNLAAPIINSIDPVTVGSPVVVTGTGVAGDNITVTLGEATETTTVDEDGNWMVSFAGIPVGEYQVVAVASRGVEMPLTSAVSNEMTAVVNAITVTPNPDVPSVPATPGVSGPLVTNPQSSLAATPFATIIGGTDATDAEDDTPTTAVRGATDSTGEDEPKKEVLAAKDSKEDWSLVNLILTILIVGLGAAGIRKLAATDKEQRKLTGVVLAGLVAAGSVVALLMVENFTGNMIWFNTWSLLLGGLAVAQVAIISMIRPAGE